MPHCIVGTALHRWKRLFPSESACYTLCMKMQLHVFVGFICLSLAAACGDDGGSSTMDSSMADTSVNDPSYKYVASQVRIGELMQSGENTIAPGFNLDGFTDNPCDDAIKDHVSPPPDNDPGVDNQLITIAEEVKGFNADLDFDALLQGGLMSGKIAILIEIAADDLTEGPAKVTFYTGDFNNAVEWSGMALEPGQEFTKRMTVTSATGTITNSRLEVEASSLPISFPAETASTGSVTLNFSPVRARFTVSQAALSDGFIGGAINSQEVIDEVMKFEANFAASIDRAFVESAVLPKSDMEPAAGGEGCEAISAGLYVTGTSANF